MKTLGLRIAGIILQCNDDGSAELTSALHSDDEKVQKCIDSIENNILLDWANGIDILSAEYREVVRALVKVVSGP